MSLIPNLFIWTFLFLSPARSRTNTHTQTRLNACNRIPSVQKLILFVDFLSHSLLHLDKWVINRFFNSAEKESGFCC